jgi:Rps23 Pro-64 3,4-dihydroxylase Tpa1-like proline 4-hydroxylase
VPHTDRSSPSDPRRVTAVYYPARERVEDEKGTEKGKGSSGRPGGDGGELVLRPSDADRRRVVEPRGDRLVAFWSDEVEHEVLGVRSDAREERLALSFWFLKPR